MQMQTKFPQGLPASEYKWGHILISAQILLAQELSHEKLEEFSIFLHESLSPPLLVEPRRCFICAVNALRKF